MTPASVMVVAGDPSGDRNAAQLVQSLAAAFAGRRLLHAAGAPPASTRFFGAGGPGLAQAGVELAFNLTGDAVIGPGDLLRKLRLLKQRFDTLVGLAFELRPDLIILVDYGAFNWRLARAIRDRLRAQRADYPGWHPKIVQYVSPQVWASRPGRADKMAQDLDLLLCLFPFEKEWYARRVPQLNVQWTGHPLLDHYAGDPDWVHRGRATDPPTIVILPGSRKGEMERHLPVMLDAARIIAQKHPARFKIVVDNDTLAAMAKELQPAADAVAEVQTGRLAQALSSAALAITKTGTITLECAYFGVPAVAIYKTSWTTYALARCLTDVKYLAMPNLLAGEPVYPELIQHEATGENIASAALGMLANSDRRVTVKSKLDAIIASLGGPGATTRATAAILSLLDRV